MVPVNEAEKRRLQRHLNVQINHVRAAKDRLRRFSSPKTPKAWRENAENHYREAIEGQRKIEKHLKELEG